MPLGNVLQTLIMLAAVSVGSVFVGSLFRRFNQPAVVGVILFGIVVGTILTASSHSFKSVLLSGTTKSLIEAVGQAGLLLLLFLVGIELRSYSRKSGERSSFWATAALRNYPCHRLRIRSLALRPPTGWPRPPPATCVVVRRCGAECHRRSRSRAPHQRSWGPGTHPGGRAANCRRG